MILNMAFWRVIILAFVTSIFAEAKWYQHQKRETTLNVWDSLSNNINDIECLRSQNIYQMHCANCHLAKKDVKPDAESWNGFESLKDINKLTFSSTIGITLTYIPTKGLKAMRNLLKLDIKYGNIEKIDTFAFANLTLIEEVTLSDNQIRILGVSAFAHHRDLTSIRLDTNNLVKINRDVFVDLPSLEKLFLTNNKITTIHDRAFIHLINLKELKINRNSIFSLNSETFKGLKNLRKLDLSGNSLKVIRNNTFMPLIHLITLNLEENKIQMLDGRAFNGLRKLNTLTLAHNKLTTIENIKTFEGMESLTLLSLKSNQLIELKPEVMAPILNNFYGLTGTLDVEDNNFPCDCRLDWFMSLKNCTQNGDMKLAIENLKCAPSAYFEHLWAQTIETEKSGGQVYEEGQIQNIDYENYDRTLSDGKLFYIDVRNLANCTNTTSHVLVAVNNGTKIQTIEVEATTKFTTKAIPSPVTTPKSKQTTEYNIRSSNVTTKDLIVKATTKVVEVKIDTSKTENETKNKESFTTVRLVTVSAKPLEHNIYDHDMASDDVRPKKIKAHGSIQEDVKSTTPKMIYNNACRNVNSVALVTMILFFRMDFYSFAHKLAF